MEAAVKPMTKFYRAEHEWALTAIEVVGQAHNEYIGLPAIDQRGDIAPVGHSIARPNHGHRLCCAGKALPIGDADTLGAVVKRKRA